MKSIPQNTSIVSLVRNRNTILADSLADWLKFDVPEIVIVDFRDDSCEWAGDVTRKFNDKRIKLIETTHEYHFHRSVGWNLAFSQTTSPFVLKLDADYLLSNDFFEKNVVDTTSFITGFHGKKTVSLTGLLFLHRNLFLRVNGFHEDLFYYGCEDNDITIRLAKKFQIKGIADETALHKPHDDSLRLAGSGKYLPGTERLVLDACIRLNIAIVESAPWTEQRQQVRWNVSNEKDGRIRAERKFFEGSGCR